MKTLREMWTSANTTVRVAVICGVTVVAVAGLAYGLGVIWLTALLGE